MWEKIKNGNIENNKVFSRDRVAINRDIKNNADKKIKLLTLNAIRTKHKNIIVIDNTGLPVICSKNNLYAFLIRYGLYQ